MPDPTGRRARPWTLLRRLADRLLPKLTPGNHHPWWDLPV